MTERAEKKPAELWFTIGLIFLVSALAFLPLVGQLGYYHDDWFTTISRVSGVSLIDMHSVDRPGMGWLYHYTSLLLGESPLAWHLYAWLVRAMGGLALLWLVRMLWPDQRTATTFMVLLYVVYPGFLQQPSANNYQNHIFAYSSTILSLGLTVWAVGKRNLALRVAAILAALGIAYLYPRVYEAMLGLEALRFLLIFYVLYRPHGGRFTQIAGKSLLWFFPFLVNGLVFVYWRFFVFESLRVSVDARALIDRYQANPLGMGLNVLSRLVQDAFEAVLAAWIVPLYQLSLEIRIRYLLLALLIALIVLSLTWLYARRGNDRSPQKEKSSAWAREAVFLGLAGVFLTLIPVTLSGREIQFRLYLDRYTYQSIVPAAMLIVGLIYLAVVANWRKWVVGTLLVLAVMTHILNAADYASFWQVQRTTWWELTWRAPQFQPGTVLVLNLPAGYRFPEKHEVWAGANRIYYPDQKGPVITAQILVNETMEELLKGGREEQNYRQVLYEIDYSRVVIFSKPSLASCLQLIDPEGVLSPYEIDLVKKAAYVSRPEQILTDAVSASPPEVIFGSEPDQDWCYYYQQASLARKQGNWAQVQASGEQAAALALAPGDPVEWLPFIEADFQAGRISQAQTKAAQIREFPGLAEQFCRYYREKPQDKIAERGQELFCSP